MPSGANRSMALRSIFSGIVGLPQSRPLENDQSVVMIRPTAPAARARSIRATSLSRPPVQYIWKKVCGLAAATSSIGLLANEDRLDRGATGGGGARDGDLTVGVHGLHAGRRDEHGQRNRLPHHGCRQVPLARQPGDVRGEAQFGERRDVVVDRQAALRARDQRAVDTLGQPLRSAALSLGDGLEPTGSGHVSQLLYCSPASGFSSHARLGARVITVSGRDREWSTAGLGISRSAAKPIRRSPERIPGSGPSNGSPVKNLAAIQPPRHPSKCAHLAHAPPVCRCPQFA